VFGLLGEKHTYRFFKAPFQQVLEAGEGN